jgi:hypothetical protein
MRKEIRQMNQAFDCCPGRWYCACKEHGYFRAQTSPFKASFATL